MTASKLIRFAPLVLLAIVAVSPAVLVAQERGQFYNDGVAHPHAGPSMLLTVTGLDGKTTPYTTADLKALPHKTISVYNEHTKANEAYEGVPLTDLLAKAGAPTGEKLRGKGFLTYVVAEGTDHYKVVYSLDETDPANHAGDVLVADTQDGAPITTDGAFKLVSTEDKRPARWVRNLSAITLKTAE